MFERPGTSRKSSPFTRAALCGAVLTLPMLAAVSPAGAQAAAPEADAIVTALPKSGDAPPLSVQQIQVSVEGKKTPPTLWKQVGTSPVELTFLIDGSAREALGRNMDEIAQFISTLPANVTVGLAYMNNGQAGFIAPFSTDHKAVAGQLHLPGGNPGSNASPYFCLSDLAKRWPSQRTDVRREVVMITDGVDEYNLRYDPEDPYVTAAIQDSQRAGLVIYSIYFRDQGRLSRSFYETNAGQNYLTQVAEETGGNLYYEGLSNPVSLVPFFQDIDRRMLNQYELGFPVRPEKKQSYVQLKVKSEVGGVKLDAPSHVAVGGTGK